LADGPKQVGVVNTFLDAGDVEEKKRVVTEEELLHILANQNSQFKSLLDRRDAGEVVDIIDIAKEKNESILIYQLIMLARGQYDIDEVAKF